MSRYGLRSRPGIQAGDTLPRLGAKWSPRRYTALALWLKASDVDSISFVAGRVSQLADKSGNARHATQGTAASRPTIELMNGKTAIAHTGTEFLEGTLPAFGSPRTVFVMWDWRAVTFVSYFTTSNSGSYLAIAQDTSTAAVSAGSGTPTLRVNGAAFAGNRDALHTLTTAAPVIMTGENVEFSNVGYRTAYGSFSVNLNPFNSGLAEVIVYDAVLTSGQRDSVEAYLADEGGITL